MKLRSAIFATIAIVLVMFSCNQARAVQHSVVLTWGPASVSGSCVLAGYTVYRTETPGSETIPNHIAALGLVHTYTDTTVVNGHTYEYKVGAFGPAPCSPTDGPLSNPATAVIPADVSTTGTPGPPTATVLP